MMDMTIGAVAAVMTDAGAAVVMGAVVERAEVSAKQVAEREELVKSVQNFLLCFCDEGADVDSGWVAKLRRGGAVQVIGDHSIEQVSRQLGESSTERCSLLTSYSDGGSSGEMESCNAVYELEGGGWLLVEYVVPEYCDDESDIRIDGLTVYPSDARDKLSADLEIGMLSVCAGHLESVSAIANAGLKSGLLDGAMLREKLKAQVSMALKGVA